ncbi:AP-5 complex subunit mu-1-like [Gigantopelta aegis]|uniref:AP-5 complex subunit mu-1-like n=1 Tax=Gigantopelta aegis TaxID=1735272 RepID=UPI001B8898DD|nr:AP-5 complex subunit mu-1-like [Gigantopelta aegis]
MSLRALWVIKLSSTRKEKCLYFRKFPTSEKKAKTIDGDAYVPLPQTEYFIQLLLTEVRLSAASSKFIVARDTCSKEDEKPVFELETSAGKLWPIVVIQQYGLLLCCLPLVEQGSQNKPPLVHIPSVSLGFSLLCGISDFLRTQTSQEFASRLAELPDFINEAAPFGIPRDTCSDTVLAKLANKVLSVPKSQKQPAWKPVLYKGKACIYLAVSECIKAAQCEQGELQDFWDVYGSIICKADLEGALPDITLNISHQSDVDCVPLDHLTIHPCVQSADSAELDTVVSRDSVPSRRIRFTPPAEMFTLCHYTASRLQELPIFGVYQMTYDSRTAKFNVNLKLSDQIKNNFEYCELQIPFYNRGVISSFETTPSQGSTSLSPDKNIVVWNVGQKFPSKTLEVSMTAIVHFSETTSTPLSSAEELFCVGQNGYAQLYFKIPEFTHTGCYIDPKSIQVSPSTKFKLTTVREYFSTDYKIWNSYGDTLTTASRK